MIDSAHTLSLRRQCSLLGIARSSIYYEPVGESSVNLNLMRIIDEIYLNYPVYGYRKMTKMLYRKGHHVNRKRVARLMRLMGLEAVYQKPNTSKPNVDHRIYPYLLSGRKIVRPNEVLCADITYIPMDKGFMYLVAIMDWHSRYVLDWELSNTLEAAFCVAALERALADHGVPEIFNTDQGCQFTGKEWVNTLLSHNIQVSMDGRGRYLDNIFIERLWRTLKYEYLYVHSIESVRELYEGLARWVNDYNIVRPHQALDYCTPYEIYSGEKCA